MAKRRRYRLLLAVALMVGLLAAQTAPAFAGPIRLLPGPIFDDGPPPPQSDDDDGNSDKPKPTLPSLPAPGHGGGHVVTRVIRDGVVYDEKTGWFRSVVVPLPGGGKAYRINWAFWFGAPDTWEAKPPFTVTCGDNVRVEWDNGVPADPQDYVVRYPRTNWRPSQAGKPFDYPTGAWFLQELAANGWLDANKIDLSGNLPDASTGGNAWRRQPTLAQVLVAAGVPFTPELESVANWPFPGKLYINLGLEAKPGESKWRILYWNYTFEVNGRLAEDTFNCKDMPPLDQPPGDDSGNPGGLDRPVVRPPGWPEVTCDYRNPAFTSQEGWWKKCTRPRLIR